ncbi:MAG: CoA transferase [Acidimicrobiia bacterium]|nr:CoA transferase [Acidimicrobiia bacterium]
MLDHIRVLDLSDERGQLCGQMLAMLGAEVIAVEPPGGSRSRRIGPFAGELEADPLDGGDREASLFHWAFNRGKRSIELDVTSADGGARLRDLAADADVLIESAGAGAMAELGLGPDVLIEANPALVVVSISAFGQTGPKAHWHETDLVVAAAAGVLALTGNEDRPPLRISLPQAYHHASIDAACAVMAALHDRQNNSGLGQHIDISAQQSFSVASQSFLLNEPCGCGPATRVAGGVRLAGLDSKVQLLWPCKDGQVSVTFLFGSALGPFTANLMNWVHEEGFCDEATRDKDWVEYANMLFDGREPLSEYERIKECLTAFFATKTKDELLAASFERRVLIAPVTTAADVVASEQWAARGFWDEVDTAAGRVRFPGPFANFSATPRPSLPAAPTLGADTDAVLGGGRRARDVPIDPATTAPAERPLAGLKVADFMWVFAGPYASRVMAELGAEVVRIESTQALDALRTAGNFQNENTHPDWALQFSNINVGKWGMTLDLGNPDARDLVHDLVRWSDITLESFSPKAMTAWGYDYESLRKVRPDLIMASSCLMGQTGPHRLLAGFGTMAAAISGFFHITGWPDLAPCGPFMAYTDYVSPRFLFTSILAAVEHRRRTGEGQYIDLSQAEASMQLQAPAILDYTVNGRVMERAGNDDPTMAPHGVYPVAGDDRWLAIAVTGDRAWKALCEALGRDDLAGLDTRARLDRRRELDEVVAAWSAGRDGEETMDELQAQGVAAHLVQNSAEAFADPQLRHRGHFVEVPHDAMGTTWVEGSRLHLSRTAPVVERGSPTLGQHTWEILTDILGYEPDRAAELIGRGIFE